MVFVLQSLKLNHMGRIHETGSFRGDFVVFCKSSGRNFTFVEKIF